MSLLRQFFQFRGEHPVKAKTMREIGGALPAAEPAPKAAADSDANPASPPAVGPCREDPALPPLNLQASADIAPETAMMLGSPPQPTAAAEQPQLIQVTPRPPRVPPLVAIPPVPTPDERKVRVAVESDSPLDAGALLRHIASFPGVTACKQIQDDAHA